MGLKAIKTDEIRFYYFLSAKKKKAEKLSFAHYAKIYSIKKVIFSFFSVLLLFFNQLLY